MGHWLSMFGKREYTNQNQILIKRLESFGIDTSKHNFLFPHLVVYDMEDQQQHNLQLNRQKCVQTLMATKLNKN